MGNFLDSRLRRDSSNLLPTRLICVSLRSLQHFFMEVVFVYLPRPRG
ncbi:hypothetical protein FOTG_19245 [Fusarium oxysporum f. sp. vasinfectum 25433]|uniref:Uncharacterized protein n=1 Tax=Fusarium oxysporum f. sp. vasinfectum 25433 TaxID=1089449 RepID=X0KF77_FUSOX|nr:hypothetical protein FOTG_19245 [Fusarium oxysporum f. sp. vasinfectum 25433]